MGRLLTCECFLLLCFSRACRMALACRFSPMGEAESVPQLFFGDAADTVQEMDTGSGKHQMVRYNPQAISFIRNNYINEQLRKR